MHLNRSNPEWARRGTGTLRKLAHDRSGLALLEFAFALPVVLALGAYGLEISNLSLLNLRISQIALNLADNSSRVGTYSTLALQQLREIDVNDVLQAARYQGASINLIANGRITLTSLENIKQIGDAAAVQRIHWQRCIGTMKTAGYSSSYGISAKVASATYSPGAEYDKTAGVNTAATGAADNASSHLGSTAAAGMGDPGSVVNAPADSGVMFVEINYLTKPLFGTLFIAPTRIHYTASYIVRDKRDFSELYPSSGVTASTCDLPV